MTKTKRIHLSLPADLVKTFDEICDKNHMSRSEAFKRLLLAIAKGLIRFSPGGKEQTI